MKLAHLCSDFLILHTHIHGPPKPTVVVLQQGFCSMSDTTVRSYGSTTAVLQQYCSNRGYLLQQYSSMSDTTVRFYSSTVVINLLQQYYSSTVFYSTTVVPLFGPRMSYNAACTLLVVMYTSYLLQYILAVVLMYSSDAYLSTNVVHMSTARFLLIIIGLLQLVVALRIASIIYGPKKHS